MCTGNKISYLVCAYVGGTIAAFWYIERIEMFWA